MDEPIKFPAYLSYNKPNDPDKRMFAVYGYISADTQPFVNGKGYIKDGYVWIFSKKVANSSKYPYFWYEHGKLCFGKLRESIKDDFHISKLTDYAITQTVYKVNPNEPLYDEDALADMNAATSVFTPDINPGDDYLKRMVKKIIIAKKININRLKSKMDKSYSLSNLKTALIGKTRMSVINFMVWADLLGFNFVIIATDKGTDTQNPLPKTIMYESHKDSFSEI